MQNTVGQPIQAHLVVKDLDVKISPKSKKSKESKWLNTLAKDFILAEEPVTKAKLFTLIFSAKSKKEIDNILCWYPLIFKVKDFFESLLNSLNLSDNPTRKIELITVGQEVVKHKWLTPKELSDEKISELCANVQNHYSKNLTAKDPQSLEMKRRTDLFYLSYLSKVKNEKDKKLENLGAACQTNFLAQETELLKAPVSEDKTIEKLLNVINACDINDLEKTINTHNLIKLWGEDIITLQKYLMDRILPTELLAREDKEKNPIDLPESATHYYLQSNKYFNCLSAVVVNTILEQKDIKNRIKQIYFFKKLKMYLREEKAYEPAFAIDAALNSGPILHLKGTWTYFEDKFPDFKKDEKWKELVDPAFNHYKFRNTVYKLMAKDVHEKCLPAIYPIATDIYTFKNQLKQEMKESNRINIELLSQIGCLVKLILNSSKGFEYKPLQTNLVHVLRNTDSKKGEDPLEKLYELSYKLEPFNEIKQEPIIKAQGRNSINEKQS